MKKESHTFAQFLHKQRLKASYKRGFWMSNNDFHAWFCEKMKGHIDKPCTAFTLYRWENGISLPPAKKMDLIKSALEGVKKCSNQTITQ